jgi:hypothetical protein
LITIKAFFSLPPERKEKKRRGREGETENERKRKRRVKDFFSLS